MANDTQLSDAAARALVDRLANDDDFRTLFVTDVEAALAAVGAPAEAARCCRVEAAQLAPKAVIQATAQALIAQLSSRLDENVHKLSI